jgi:hypothetical protein
MVFLSGEVVVDYALRLKREFDPARLWVTAYANYVPCYIPSRRILDEGGYEAEESLWYYDRPTRISTNAEEVIIKNVHELLPKSFLFDKQKAESPPPKTVEQALASFQTKSGFTIENVAAEPLVESPVAIDWGTDGRLWVCEMNDYPSGLDGNWKPGGRVKILQDSDGDGRYDKATAPGLDAFNKRWINIAKQKLGNRRDIGAQGQDLRTSRQDVVCRNVVPKF